MLYFTSLQLLFNYIFVLLNPFVFSTQYPKPPSSHHLFNIILEVLARTIRQESIQIRKEEVKLSPFANSMILSIESPKDSAKNLLETINKHSRGTGCKINAQNIDYISILLTMTFQKTSFVFATQNKIPMNKLNTEYEGPINWKLEGIIKRNWRRHKEMERVCVNRLD